MLGGSVPFLARRMLSGRRLPADELPGRRYIRGATVGVALSLVPLVVVLVVADGMIQGITSRYLETSTYHVQAHPFVRESPTSLQERAARLSALPGIAAAYAEIQGPAVALAGSGSAGAAIRAVDPAFLKDPGAARYLSIAAGELSLSSPSEIVLGEALARSLGVGVGATVSMVTARSYPSGDAGFAPKVSVFRVKGIVSAGYRELDALWAFVSIKAGSRVLAPETSHSLVGIKVADPYADLAATRDSIAAALPPDWTIVTWPEAERNLWKSFATTRALLLLIMALVVAVAAINVGSALVMLVIERRKDIAILKSQGATPSFLASVFVLAGLAIGGVGTVFGLALGSLVAWRVNDLIAGAEFLVNAASRVGALIAGRSSPSGIKLLDPAYYLERIPVRIPLGELGLVAASSLGLCLLASLLAARRASRLPPLEIFRKI